MTPQRRSWTDGPLGLLCLLTVDAIALLDACALGYLCRFEWGLLLPPLDLRAPLEEYVKAWALAVYLLLLLFHAYGLYDRQRVRDPLDSLRPLLQAATYALILLLALSYFYRGFSYSRVAVLYSSGFAVLLLGSFRMGWEAYRNTQRAKGVGVTPVILVGSRCLPRALAQRIAETPSYGYRIVGAVDTVAIERSVFPEVPTGLLSDLPRLLESTRAREVLIGHPALTLHQLLDLIEVCESRSLPIRMVPATYDLLIDANDFREVGGIPLVTVNERRPRVAYRVAKRALDIGVSFTALIVSAPFLLAVALAVRATSPGPALFRQQRVGRDGRVFWLYKVRTMVQGAEDLLPSLVNLDALPEPVFKIDNDPRITPLGKILRRFSIDEVPQLWNVLRGDMSLVGPRPEESAVVARYDVWQRRRLKLTPGITGLQQIHCRGTRSLQQRLRWDILYLRKESILLDLWILLRTFRVVWRGEGNL
ncbi:MAG: sugar transferase [Planctomycetota bacterium]